MNKQVVADLQNGKCGIAITLLHYPSPVGAKCGNAGSLLVIGGVDPDVVAPIPKVNFSSEGIPNNTVKNVRLIRNVRWLHNCILLFGYQVI